MIDSTGNPLAEFVPSEAQVRHVYGKRTLVRWRFSVLLFASAISARGFRFSVTTPRGVITLFRNSVFDDPNNKASDRQVRCPRGGQHQLPVASRSGAARPPRPRRTPRQLAAEAAACRPGRSKDSRRQRCSGRIARPSRTQRGCSNRWLLWHARHHGERNRLGDVKRSGRPPA